ncbi:hypothetical protein IV203_028799 [Nitzschia inconspicua]|uniref:Uncharacterized protein n=1 Tax=Nitzschia inconspicua TaxID=303405 RepID=A0A9K3LQM7_9STRA|nr:hypothetical protein IV203_028799 [Nitzschia inconspicua]
MIISAATTFGRMSVCVLLCFCVASSFVEGYLLGTVCHPIARKHSWYRYNLILKSLSSDSLDPLDLVVTNGGNAVDTTVAKVSIVEGSVEEPIPPSLWNKLDATRSVIPISVALTIAVFSVLEILESIRELNERHTVGHAHGVTLLAALRLGRSMAFFKILRHKHTVITSSHKLVRFKSKTVMHAIKGAAALQTQTEELDEKVVELMRRVRGTETKENCLICHSASPLDILYRMKMTLVGLLTSTSVAITAATLAVVACVVEIVDDMQPGAHHGAALLALSELCYQIRRVKARVKSVRNRTSNWRTSTRMGRILSKAPMGPCIAVAAAMYAAIEICADLRPGAHHGVAILALAELVENVNRSKILNQFSGKSECRL